MYYILTTVKILQANLYFIVFRDMHIFSNVSLHITSDYDNNDFQEVRKKKLMHY